MSSNVLATENWQVIFGYKSEQGINRVFGEFICCGNQFARDSSLLKVRPFPTDLSVLILKIWVGSDFDYGKIQYGDEYYNVTGIE